MNRNVVLLILFSLLLATSLSASESFTLNIPLRFNAQQETGEVRITLTLSAAPAGSQLVVGGSTTLNLGQTLTVAGDSVTYEAAGGNDVRIVYKPLSNFGANLCDGASAVEKNIAMRFSGAQDVTAYRVSTYIVAAPMAECSAASKHTGDSPATLIPAADGVAPALAATNRGRHPYDVVLVLDKSGSMSGLPPGAVAGATKAEILRSAAKAFVAAWREIDQPSGTGEWSQDRIGVVFFDHTIAPQTLAGADPPANFFLQRGVGIPGPWQTVLNNIDTLTPTGATSIGGGINEGMSKWKADPKHDLTLIVVTDGMQNFAPLIQPTGTGFLGLAPVSGLPQELRQRFIPIQTIGFGEPAAVDEQLLRNISLETAGMSYIALNATTMFDVFAMTLVAILKGNTASLATNFHGTMTGSEPGAFHKVDVDRSVQRVVFVLQWAPPVREALELEVFPPGAAAPAAPTSASKTPQAALQTFDTDRDDIGTWRVRVKRAKGATKEPVPYTLNVLFLERHLDSRISFDTLHARTGDRLGIRAVLAWDGKPLTDLPKGAIRARVSRPSAALGNVLREKRTESTPLRPAKGDPQSAYDVKIAALARTGALDKTRPQEVATIALEEVAKGVYAASFDESSVPGSYRFDLVFDWNDERTGRIHREERLETYVKASADASKTEMKTTRIDAQTVQISITPRDRFGNFLGPGYASSIDAKLKSSGKLSAPIDRASNGTYILTITNVPRGETPQVEIAVDGVKLAGGK